MSKGLAEIPGLYQCKLIQTCTKALLNSKEESRQSWRSELKKKKLNRKQEYKGYEISENHYYQFHD